MSGLRTESGAGASGWLDGPRQQQFADASDNTIVGTWLSSDGDDWCRVEIGEPGNIVWCPLSSGVFQVGAAVVVHLATDGTPASVDPPKKINESSPTTAVGHQGEALQAAGEPGVSVTGATINSSGHLILQLSDGTSVDCGQVKPDLDKIKWTETSGTTTTGEGAAGTNAHNFRPGVWQADYNSGYTGRKTSMLTAHGLTISNLSGSGTSGTESGLLSITDQGIVGTGINLRPQSSTAYADGGGSYSFTDPHTAFGGIFFNGLVRPEATMTTVPLVWAPSTGRIYRGD